MSSSESTKRLVVTGAASGIGRALTELLVANGHRVLGLDRTVDGLADGVEPIVCDLTDPGAVAGAVERVGGRVGTNGDGATTPVDGLAAVAGVPGTAGPDVVFGVNVLGLRRLTEALLPAIRDGGSVVLLSSLAGYRGTATPDEASALLASTDEAVSAHVAASGWDGPRAYQESKQLVHRYAVELAARLHGRRIRATSVSPGPVRTPILRDFRATMPSLDEATRVVGRAADPGEIAEVVAFLLSPAASWVNGLDIPVDGGLSALRSVGRSRQDANATLH